jgi:hypothetical protein
MSLKCECDWPVEDGGMDRKMSGWKDINNPLSNIPHGYSV